MIHSRILAMTAAAPLLLAAGTAGPAQAGRAAYASTAVGTVFFPNPVQQLGLQNLTDAKDADLPVLEPAYQRQTLTNLDGSDTLTGAYVTVKSSTGKAAVATGGVFPDWHRDTDQFEQ